MVCNDEGRATWMQTVYTRQGFLASRRYRGTADLAVGRPWSGGTWVAPGMFRTLGGLFDDSGAAPPTGASTTRLRIANSFDARGLSIRTRGHDLPQPRHAKACQAVRG